MPRKNKKEIIMTWELTCSQCKSNFEGPVPRGPREEKELKCPKCGSKYIERIEALSQGAPPQCGG
jgi:DNA-directed RNA polymerase subunit RPC12/RpoP